MTLEPTVLAELRAQLETEKSRLENELGRIAKPVDEVGDYATKFDDLGTDVDDNASEVEEYVDNLAVEDNLERQLHEVIEALERMDNGTYGHCHDCNQEIPLDRLRAYPAAKDCIQCSK